MARYVVIASRTRSDLYGYLQQQFADDDDTQVLVDRRQQERRRRQETQTPDRRRWHRRSGRGEDSLHTHGFFVVRQLSPGSSVRMHWRPPWWESGKPEGSIGIGQSPCPSEELQPVATTQTQSIGCITEVEGQPGTVTKLLLERGQLMARAETAERKCQRLEHEMKYLRSAIEQFKRERRHFAVTVQSLTRKLAESSVEEF